MGFPQRNSRTNQPDLRLCQQTRLEINDLHRPRERLSIHLINWRATSIGIASAARVVGRSGRGPVFPRVGSFPDRDFWFIGGSSKSSPLFVYDASRGGRRAEEGIGE